MTTATRKRADGLRRQRIRRLPDLSTHLAFWLPAANVLMQLADPAVGYGVLEGRVTSGRGDLRPVKSCGWRCAWSSTTRTSGR